MGCNGLARITPKAVRELGGLEVYPAWPGSSRAPPARPPADAQQSWAGRAGGESKAPGWAWRGAAKDALGGRCALPSAPVGRALAGVTESAPDLNPRSLRYDRTRVAGGGGQRLPHAWAGRPDTAACISGGFWGEGSAALPSAAKAGELFPAGWRGAAAVSALRRSVTCWRGGDTSAGPGTFSPLLWPHERF